MMYYNYYAIQKSGLLNILINIQIYPMAPGVIDSRDDYDIENNMDMNMDMNMNALPLPHTNAYSDANIDTNPDINTTSKPKAKLNQIPQIPIEIESRPDR